MENSPTEPPTCGLAERVSRFSPDATPSGACALDGGTNHRLYLPLLSLSLGQELLSSQLLHACCDGGRRDGGELAEELVAAAAEAQVPGWSKRGRV